MLQLRFRTTSRRRHFTVGSRGKPAAPTVCLVRPARGGAIRRRKVYGSGNVEAAALFYVMKIWLPTDRLTHSQ